MMSRAARTIQAAAVLVLGAWAVVTAAAAAPTQLTEQQARHFLIRTGFAPTQAEVDALTGQSAEAAVTTSLARAKAAKSLNPPPDFTTQAPPTPRYLLKTADERQAYNREQYRQALDLKSWWVREMIESPAPLAERMTLFWHNHFATSMQKVVHAQAMWRQHQVLRADALGSFATLLHAVAKDPAMLVYLDGANSRREAPNENFAREVMELFTLGEAGQGGGYTESDIREAARAFTGWSVERADFSYRYRPAFHDDGAKTVLGQSGPFNGDQVLDILLDQPATARFITSKLWKEFVSPTPEAKEVDRIAQRLRASHYDVSVALRELLLSDAFWAPGQRGSLIKSPIDLVVGSVRQFSISYTDALPLVLSSAQLGQNLLMPPNVKGWPGFTDWINATQLLERKRFSERLFRPADAMQTAAGPGNNRILAGLMGSDGMQRLAQASAKISFDADKWFAIHGGRADSEPSEEFKTRLALMALESPATQNIANGTVAAAYLRALMLDPAYQLK